MRCERELDNIAYKLYKLSSSLRNLKLDVESLFRFGAVGGELQSAVERLMGVASALTHSVNRLIASGGDRVDSSVSFYLAKAIDAALCRIDECSSAIERVMRVATSADEAARELLPRFDSLGDLEKQLSECREIVDAQVAMLRARDTYDLSY